MSKKKNILVVGANGLLGTAFRTEMQRCDNYYFGVRKYTDIKGLDVLLGNIEDLTIERDAEKFMDFDVVINCAAATNVDEIEKTWDANEKAIKTNIEGVERLAKICKHVGATLIHISTDYVFDGTIGREYFPSDAHKPLNMYGATKSRGEDKIIESGCKYIIIRTSWIYSPYTPNFVTKMIDKSLNNEDVYATDNIISSPTSAVNLVSAIDNLIHRNLENNIGIYHFTDSGCCTRFDMISFIYSYLNSKGLVSPQPDSFWGSEVKRPFCSVMSKESFKKLFGITPPNWMFLLKECIEEYLHVKNMVDE